MQSTSSRTISSANHRNRTAADRFIAAVDLLLTWQQRANERRQLAAFDDHMLRDIGLSRADIEAELRKPFWRP